MSGHSKWSQIKRKKAKTDQARGKVFSKLVREITTAARLGGDPKMNMRLKTAIEEAKAVNMPADTLKRAIQKGTGELPGETYEEITYEGYGPGGVAVMVKVLTDNKNRTAPEIRHTFAKFGGINIDVRPLVHPRREPRVDRLLEMLVDDCAESVRETLADVLIQLPERRSDVVLNVRIRQHAPVRAHAAPLLSVSLGERRASMRDFHLARLSPCPYTTRLLPSPAKT